MHFGDVRIVDEDGGTGQMNLQYDFGYGMIVQSLRLFGKSKWLMHMIYTGNKTYLKIAKEQFNIGSKYFWYENNPIGKFATGKNHSILSTGGNVFMGVCTGRISPIVVRELSFTVEIEDVTIVKGVIYVNFSVSTNSNVTMNMVQYGIDDSQGVNVSKPIDGVYDSQLETVHIEINGTMYQDGMHIVWIRVIASNGYTSEKFNFTFKVRTLSPRYNLIALSIKPPKPIHASDLALAIDSVVGIWRWNVESQEYESYIPGVSSSNEDFPIEIGYGYFIYLSKSSKFVEFGNK